MNDMPIRIFILWLVVVGSFLFLDLPPKISEINALKAKLFTLPQKKIAPRMPSVSIAKDERHSEEMLNAFLNYFHHRGVFISSMNHVTVTTHTGFMETHLSVQMIGDFIPLLSAIDDIPFPILMHHFTVNIENGIAAIVTNIVIFHVKKMSIGHTLSVGTLQTKDSLFRIQLLTNGSMQWRKI